MPHVSSKKLKKKAYKRIYSQLIKILANTRGKSETSQFLNELLTPTEKEMLSKRLTILILIKEGLSLYKIRKHLKISQSTITRFYRQTYEKDYSYISKIVKDKKAKKEFWEGLELLLRAGMPPIAGPGRWKWLDNYMKKSK